MKKLTRRDRLYLLSKRAMKLSDKEKQFAWESLTWRLEAHANVDLPKFDDLFEAIRRSIIAARRYEETRSHFIFDESTLPMVRR